MADNSQVRAMRSSGVLLHPTSLPGGRLGEEAYRFVDWLAAAGQSWWQILPLGPPDEYGSPYRSTSAFACWPGLLAEPDADVSAAEIESFVARHPFWSGDWEAFAGEGALADQARFEREWRALRGYARKRRVSLIGDVPIYIAPGSADHRANPELFLHDVVAGVPPDDWSATGQLWGNPLYDWRAMRSTGYRWWIERFRRTFELVDAARVDHFRGFVAYWAVPKRSRTALAGGWRRGPGRELFDAVARELGELPLIAEDLGVITPPVERLRDELELPGMAVLQFAFDGSAGNPHLPRNHRRNAVVYTGTHDNDTTVGWYAALDANARGLVHSMLGVGDTPAVPEILIEAAYASNAALAIVPLQDLLARDSRSRMNTPGTVVGNWRWRFSWEEIPASLSATCYDRAVRSGRDVQTSER